MEEDPTIKFEQNAETHQQVISGLGEQHLDVIVSKLKSKFGVDVDLTKPRRSLPRDHPQDGQGAGQA